MNKFFIALSLAILPCMAMAQDNEDLKHGPYEKTKFTDNLYVGIDGGLNWAIGKHMFDDPTGERIGSPMFTLYAGKWINPIFGTTIEIEYARPYYGGRREQFAVGLEIPVNLSNWIYGYKENRFYNFIVALGGGTKFGFDKGFKEAKDIHKTVAFISTGIQNQFRINKNWDFNFNVAYNAFTRDVFLNGDNTFCGDIELSIGLSYTFNPGFKAVERCGSATCHAACDTKISDLERQLADCNNLKGAAIAALEKEKARQCPPAKAGAPTMSVFFRINSAKVMDNYKYNLQFYADAIKGSNDTYTVYGYADLQTGSRSYNEKLALKRAETVKKILVEEYGCNADQIICSAGDLDNAPFDKTIYNRAVLVKTK